MKLYVSTVFGSTSKELEPAERWIWVGFLALAGDSQWDGVIKATVTLGYSDEQLADLLAVDTPLLRAAKRKMIKADKITVDEKGIISINNWEKYQSEYDRQKKYRGKSYKIRLHDGVTPSSPSISYSSFLSLIENKNLKWEGITDEDLAAWGEAYPACDIQRELLAMIEWIKANPKRGMKKDYHQFIIGWLARSQKSGGGMRSAVRVDQRQAEVERERRVGAPNEKTPEQKAAAREADRLTKEFMRQMEAKWDHQIEAAKTPEERKKLRDAANAETQAGIRKINGFEARTQGEV